MKRMLGKLPFLLVIATSLAMVNSSAGFAEVGQGGGVLQGGGSISPGLSKPAPCVANVVFCPPSPQTFTFSGTLTGEFVVGTNVAVGSVSCTFNGNDPDGSLTVGGPGTTGGTCSGTGTVNVPPPGTVSVSAPALTFVRVGGAVVVEGGATVTLNGHTSTGVVECTLVFVPGQLTPPVTTYTVDGICGFIGV